MKLPDRPLTVAGIGVAILGIGLIVAASILKGAVPGGSASQVTGLVGLISILLTILVNTLKGASIEQKLNGHLASHAKAEAQLREQLHENGITPPPPVPPADEEKK